MKFLQKNFTTIMVVFALLSIGMQLYLCYERSSKGCGCSGKKDNGAIPGAGSSGGTNEPSPIK